MPQTNIPAGSPLAKKLYGAALFNRIIKAPSLINRLTGPAPKQSDAEAKLKGQTSPDMPVVRVTDLSKSQGDAVSVDAFDTISGKPIMGDRNAEGKGEKLSSSSMDIKIDLSTKVVDAGGKMTNQRTVHNLRGIAMAQIGGYFPRLKSQQLLTHAAGARGSQTGRDWVLPLSSDAEFSEIMINTVLAPTYNRHFVVDAGNVIAGGQQLGSIDSTDRLSIDHLDALSLVLDDLEFPMPYVRIPDDPAADDAPIKAVMFVTLRQWNDIQINAAGSSTSWRTFLQNAWNRKSYGSKHPLFSGEPGMWRGILVRVLDRQSIRFLASESTNIITAANRYTATETAQTVNAGLAAGFAVERAILMGGQAVADVYGRNQSSDYYFSWLENKYNFERNTEVAGEAMCGMSKLRFKFLDANGNSEPTDLGAMVVDTAVKL